MYRFCYDSAAILRWKFVKRSFFALTRVTPRHLDSTFNLPYLNRSKQVFDQCLAPEQSGQCLSHCCDKWTSRRGIDQEKFRVIGCCCIKTINTIFILSILALVFAFIAEKLRIVYFLIVSV